MTSEQTLEVMQSEFRRVMSSFATGVAVVTTELDGARFGVTVNSLTSVSLDPLVLLVCLAKASTTANMLIRRRAFVVSLLNANQEEISRRFVNRTGDRFQGVRLESRDDGLPAIADALGHISCRVISTRTVGDHVVVFGQVEGCKTNDGAPLLYYRRGYHRLPA